MRIGCDKQMQWYQYLQTTFYFGAAALELLSHRYLVPIIRLSYNTCVARKSQLPPRNPTRLCVSTSISTQKFKHPPHETLAKSEERVERRKKRCAHVPTLNKTLLTPAKKQSTPATKTQSHPSTRVCGRVCSNTI